ncbi:MAG: hypothetical protein A4E58_03108 [Syntrophorhabdus sp. PtaB.Bin006]|nr:MAG: hypothetical protein A4E58_03108 [Syntrophorhabdus sp. PtaB.Bin006]
MYSKPKLFSLCMVAAVFVLAALGSWAAPNCNWSRTNGDGDYVTTLAVAANFVPAATDLVTNCQTSGNCNNTTYTVCSDSTGNLMTELNNDYSPDNAFTTYGYFFAADATSAEYYNGHTGTGTAYSYAKGVPVFFAEYNAGGIHAVGHLLNSQSDEDRSLNIATTASGYTINTADSKYIAVANTTAPYGVKSHTIINTMMGTSLPGTIPTAYITSPLYGNIGAVFNAVTNDTNKSGFGAKSQICSGSGGVNTTYVYVEFTNGDYILNQKAIKLNSSTAATRLDDYINTTLGCPSGASWQTFVTNHCYKVP